MRRTLLGTLLVALGAALALGIVQTASASHTSTPPSTPQVSQITQTSAAIVTKHTFAYEMRIQIRRVGHPWQAEKNATRITPGIPNFAYTYTTLNSGETYEVRARAWTDPERIWTPWSDITTFTTLDPPPPEERRTGGGKPPPGYMVLTVSEWCPEGCLEPPGKLNFKTCHWEECNEPEGGYPYSIANQTPEQPPLPGDPPDKPTEGTFGGGRIHEPETRQGNCPAGFVNKMRADGGWSEHCYSTTTGDPVGKKY